MRTWSTPTGGRVACSSKRPTKMTGERCVRVKARRSLSERALIDRTGEDRHTCLRERPLPVCPHLPSRFFCSGRLLASFECSFHPRLKSTQGREERSHSHLACADVLGADDAAVSSGAVTGSPVRRGRRKEGGEQGRVEEMSSAREHSRSYMLVHSFELVARQPRKQETEPTHPSSLTIV